MSNDLHPKLRGYAIQKRELVEHCTNEEQTKISLINPYLELLGFDVRDPRRVRLEFGTFGPQGKEKVDYAIMENSAAVVIIEAKPANTKFTDEHLRQLERYAQPVQMQSVKFAAITDGIKWHWYFKEKNLLVKHPFAVIDALNPKETDADWLSALASGVQNSETMGMAKGELLTTQFAEWFDRAQQFPSKELLKVVYKETYPGEPFPREGSRQFESMKDGWKRACERAKEAWIQNRPDGERQLKNEPLPSKVLTTSPIDEAEQTKRSCRVRIGSDSEQLKDATALMLRVLRYCAESHHSGEHDYLRSLTRPVPPLKSDKAVIGPDESLEGRRKKYTASDYKGFRVFKNLNNQDKARLIASMLAECRLHDGSSPVIGRHLEIELPNTKFQ